MSKANAKLSRFATEQFSRALVLPKAVQHKAPAQFYFAMALIAFLLIAPASYGAKEPPPGAGVDSSIPANILLSIDNSSSMNNSTKRIKAPETMPMDFAGSGDGSWHLAHGASISRYGQKTSPLAKPFRKYNSAGTWLKDYGDGFSLNYAGYPDGPHIPSRIAIDQYDNLYLAHCKTSKIHKFDARGVHVKSFSTPNPLAIDIDSKNNIYVTALRTKGQEVDCSPGGEEPGPFLWRKLDPSGTLLGEWPIAIEPTYKGDPGKGYYPKGLAVYDDSVYIVSDTSYPYASGRGYPGKIAGIHDYCKRGYPVRVYNKETGEEEDTWWALGGTDIEATANGIYILGAEADYAGRAVRDPKTKKWTEPSCGGHVGKYSYSGTFIKRFAPKQPACGPLGGVTYPKGMGSDPEGNIYLVGGNKNPYLPKYLKKYDKNGKFITQVMQSKSRRETVKCVLTRLLQNEELNKKVNYGLLVWSTAAKMAVGISPGGAEEIVPMVTEYCGTNCAFGKTPRGGTNLEVGMSLAKDYFENRAAGFTPGPIDPEEPCQRNFIIVLSDGEWGGRSPDPYAARLLRDLDVKSLVVGFDVSSDDSRVSDVYESFSQAGGTHPLSPLYADNEVELHDSLMRFISKAQKSDLRYTGTAPVIPSASGDHIYQSGFTIPENGQWRGKLTKYSLDSDTGAVGSVVWEAGAQLNLKDADSRRIWTVAYDAGVPDGLNNFTPSNVAGLKTLLYEGASPIPPDSKAAQLIGFIRGTDSYDEDIDLQVGDQREWKLGDIYHSEMAIVGPPAAINTKQAGNPKSEEYYKKANNYQEFFEANVSRPTVVYVGANDGMLHAFRDDTGEELWGFVPPNILPALRQMTTSVPNTTIPIYGVDGSPAVRDIYFDHGRGGHWRTILITGLGRDGYGYFALDITNPLNPKFLFALSNDPVNRVVRHWGPTGNLTENNYGSIPSEFEYSKLGQAWSTPTINLVPLATTSPKWLAIIGGGFNGSESQEYGSAAYLIELATAGRRRSRLDLPDTKGGFINSVPAQFTAVTPDTTPKATYQGAISYVVDMESKLFKFNFTDSGKPYAYDLIFDGEGNNVNQRASFMPVTVTTDSGEDSDKKVWLYFGTGNQDKLELSQSTIQNRIFGIKDKKFPLFGDPGKPTISDLKNVTDKAASCPKEDDLGWYVNLGKDEKVTNKIQISDKVLFAPLYTPDVSQGCFPGTSALAELGYGCGKVLRRTELGAGLITGARIFNNKVYVGISGTPDNEEAVSLGGGFTKKGSIISGEIATPSASNSQKAVIESWRERF